MHNLHIQGSQENPETCGVFSENLADEPGKTHNGGKSFPTRLVGDSPYRAETHQSSEPDGFGTIIRSIKVKY